jgi:hypothetical protein
MDAQDKRSLPPKERLQYAARYSPPTPRAFLSDNNFMLVLLMLVAMIVCALAYIGVSTVMHMMEPYTARINSLT